MLLLPRPAHIATTLHADRKVRVQMNEKKLMKESQMLVMKNHVE